MVRVIDMPGVILLRGGRVSGMLWRVMMGPVPCAGRRRIRFKFYMMRLGILLMMLVSMMLMPVMRLMFFHRVALLHDPMI